METPQFYALSRPQNRQNLHRNGSRLCRPNRHQRPKRPLLHRLLRRNHDPCRPKRFPQNLEEPSPRHHFVLITKTPSALLETVLSRAQIFYLKTPGTLEQPVAADEKIKTLAKTLITADPKTLISLANDLAKHKDNPRAFALDVVGTAIELTYKTYFSSGEPKFLKKLKNLLTLYDNLAKNGHVKLHIVADML